MQFAVGRLSALSRDLRDLHVHRVHHARRDPHVATSHTPTTDWPSFYTVFAGLFRLLCAPLVRQSSGDCCCYQRQLGSRHCYCCLSGSRLLQNYPKQMAAPDQVAFL
mgnify:CR=1 FL=1